MDIRRRIGRAYRAYRRRKTWQRFVRAMAMVVVFCTTYALILPAITLETETVCGLTEHTHTDACYGPAATVSPELHYHGEDCYESTLLCELEQTEGHSHTEACQGTVKTLICEDVSPEHEHQATCYAYETGLVCGLEETEAHSHSESCWTSVLVCGLEEGSVLSAETGDTASEAQTVLICGLEEHSHEESCYSPTETQTPAATEAPSTEDTENLELLPAFVCGREEHTHGDSCYSARETGLVLSCSLEEHSHDASCCLVTDDEESEVSGGDVTADVETQADWEASLSAVVLSGERAEDLIAVAKSQLGYTESSLNYIYDENGRQQAYTRYGQWYGSPYAPWSALFVSFCLHYAGVESLPAETDCQLLLETLNAAELYRTEAQHSPAAGDLVFIDRDLDAVCDHVAIAEAVMAENDAVTLQLIAGDWDGCVDRAAVAAEDSRLLGYVPLELLSDAGEEGDVPPFSYTGEEVAKAQVTLGEGSAVPDDAALSVDALSSEDEQYIACAQQIEALVEEDVLGMTLWDISFYDAAGEYLSVSDTAQVTLTLAGDVFGDCQVKVFHFVDGTPVELENVTVRLESVTDDEGTESLQTVLGFETDGFSLFAAISVESAFADRVAVTLAADELNGKSVYIACQDGTRFILCSANSDSNALNGVLGDYGAMWTFQADSDSIYRIFSTVDGVKKYMVMDASNGYMRLTEAETDASVFTATYNNGRYTLSVGKYFVNEYGGHNNFSGFKGYNVSGDNGNNLILYSADTYATELGGQTLAIINVHDGTSVAMSTAATTETDSGNANAALAAITVTTQTADGITCYDGENVPLWTFTAVDADNGLYTISTTVGTETLYLNVPDTGNGGLTTSTTPQNLRVTLAGDGKVYIGNEAGTTTIQSAAANGSFWCCGGTGDSNQMILCQELAEKSSFTITYGDRTITVYLKDEDGQALTATCFDRVLTVSNSVDADNAMFFADIAPDVDGYTYSHALYGTINVASVGACNSTGFRIYEQEYYDGQTDQFYTRYVDVEITLVYTNTTVTPRLHYAISLPGTDWIDCYGDEATAPSVLSTSQSITAEAGNIYTVSGRDSKVNVFLYNTLYHRSTEKSWYANYNTALGDSIDRESYLPPGAEYEFLGWQATNTERETCLIPENAAVVLDETGEYILVTDVNGEQQILPPGTTLTGQWKMVSNVILFYVNHGDTMLEDEDGQPIQSTDSTYYTDIAAIGHIYNIDDPNAYAAKNNTIWKSADEEITSLFQPAYDPNNANTQIVIDAVKKFDTSGNAYYDKAANYTDALLEAAITAYIHSQDGKEIKLDGAILDKEDINSQNYLLYWYGMKLVDSDANVYHADGVLVARTQTMEIYKTFSGLTREQAKTAIGNMSFPLYLLHENATDGTIMDDYTTMVADSSQSGVYSYDGPQSDSSNIFKWTLESVQGQRYAFEEAGYTLDGYDCSSLVSVHYKDGTVEYRNNTDATYENAEAVYQKDNAETEENEGLIIDYYKITDRYAAKPLVGGQVESVIFANFYTKSGTGAFSISKVVDDAGAVRLAGAEFTLSQNSTVLQTVVTNENGAAHFSNLAAGTYTLAETKAPAGYQIITDTTWTVVVDTDNDNVTVTIQESGAGDAVTLYDLSAGGVQQVYRIKNEPVVTTMTVNKTFTTITEAQVKELKDYCIELCDADNKVLRTMTLGNATAITGVMNGYTWTLTDIEPREYRLVEKGFVHENYLDTVVTAQVNGTAVSAVKSEENTVATIAVTKSGQADTVDITNDYTNTFRLKIVKVDATTNSNAPMAGVVFNIYGAYGEGGGESITYKDAQGNEHTVFLVGTTQATDANGITWYDDMKLSPDGRSFLYVVDEVSTPAGYVKLSEPIVQVITVDEENYTDGVYTMTVENYKPSLATVSVTAQKVWDVPEDMEIPGSVTLDLYRKTVNPDGSNGGVRLMDTVTLDGKSSGSHSQADDVATDNINNAVTTKYDGWKVVWSNLSYADDLNTDESVLERRYEYYVAELTDLPGFSTRYSYYTESLLVGTETVTAARATGEELERSLTITNTSGYQLPASGGSGSRWFILLGLALMALAIPWPPWPRASAGPMQTPRSRGAPTGSRRVRSLGSGPGRRRRGGGDSS